MSARGRVVLARMSMGARLVVGRELGTEVEASASAWAYPGRAGRAR